MRLSLSGSRSAGGFWRLYTVLHAGQCSSGGERAALKLKVSGNHSSLSSHCVIVCHTKMLINPLIKGIAHSDF